MSEYRVKKKSRGQMAGQGSAVLLLLPSNDRYHHIHPHPGRIHNCCRFYGYLTVKSKTATDISFG